MIKFNALSLAGFSGKIFTEVIIGGELVLDLGPTSFCFSQDKFRMKKKRKKSKVMVLVNDHNP
jgi:hypothetical protein